MGKRDNERYFVREQQISNKRKSNLLVLSLVLLILLISIGIGVSIFDSPFIGLTIGIVTTITVVPIQFLLSKAIITNVIGGRKIGSDFRDKRLQKVRSQLEGLTIAAGLKRTPDLYLLPTNIPNAFAGGLDERTAYIGISQGLIDMLDNEETEGVLAHEVAHIMNLDIRLNTIVLSLVTVLGVLGDILYYGGLSGLGDSDDVSAGLLTTLAVISSLILAPFVEFIGNLIFLGVSRKREFLADATAVSLCGYNEGLIRALQKLSIRTEPYTKKEKRILGGNTMMAMYFNNPGTNLKRMFSTHPPIEERIRILQKTY